MEDGQYRHSASFSLGHDEHGRLMHDYNEEARYGLEDLAEDSEEEDGKRTSFDRPHDSKSIARASTEPRRPLRTLAFK